MSETLEAKIKPILTEQLQANPCQSQALGAVHMQVTPTVGLSLLNASSRATS
jgi:hypothetical protein